MKRKSKSRAAAKEPGLLARWWMGLDITARHKTILGLIQAFFLAALAGGSIWGVLAAKKFVLTQPDFAPATALTHLELADRPEWMTDALAEDIRAELMGGSDVQNWVFDPTLTRRVGQAAAACPWIKSIQNVEIERQYAAAAVEDPRAAGRIIVRAQYRRPVAVLESGRDQYVDAQGVLLPAEQVAKLGIAQLPKIINQTAACPQVGQVWRGPDIQAALTVLGLLEKKSYYHEITAVDVDCRRNAWSGGNSPIILFAGSDEVLTRICFGSLPVGNLDRVPGQPTTARKMGYLDGWYKLNGRRLAGPELLDLRFETSLTVSPRDYVPGSSLAVSGN